MLIYIGVLFASSSISPSNSILPFSKGLMNNGSSASSKDPKKSLREKRTIEQWIFTVLMIALILPAITLMTGLSNVITQEMNVYDPSKDGEEKISVYVKNAKGKTTMLPSNTSLDTVMGNGIQDKVEKYINDSATNGNWEVYVKDLSGNREGVAYNIYNQMPSASVIKLFIAAAAYEKFGVNSKYENDINIMISNSDNNAANRLIDAIGGISAVNRLIDEIGGISDDNSYETNNDHSSTKLNRKFGITGYSASNDNYSSAEEVGALLQEIYNGTCVSEAASKKIYEYMKNQTHRGKIPAGITGGEVANKTGELSSSSYANGPIENDAAIVHKDDVDYLIVVFSSNVGDDGKAIKDISEIAKIVDEEMSDTSNSDSSGGSGIKKVEYINYTFNTNLEGLLMFLSQYSWSKHPVKNVINIWCGANLTLFKIIMYFFYILRMILVGILIAIAPLVVLINGFMRISGNKGILYSWVKIFIYCLFIRPVIGLIYYICAKLNVEKTADNPVYVLLAIVVTVIVLIFSIKKLVSDIKSNKNQVNINT